ncbi:unnamed protein product [Linum trigynum]|uniref:Uncharacterized protein n=1 Tax=Linum trigynum TaxID=586398 RepID=A0AAV2FSP0_9ROSI
MLGKPLWFDQSTRLGRRMGFPKVCVEMSIDSPFPDSIKLVPDRKTAFLVALEYCNRPLGCQKCRIFGHQCAEPQGVEANGSDLVQNAEPVTEGARAMSEGGAGQLILDTILASRGSAQASAESACHNLNVAVANLVKSIEQGVLSEWRNAESVLPSDKEFHSAIEGQSDARASTPVANRFQSLVDNNVADKAGQVVDGSPVLSNLEDFPVLEAGVLDKGKQGKKGQGRPAKPKNKK